MLSYDFQNHTPLDFQKLKQHYTSPSTPRKEAMKLPTNLANLFLVGSLVLFVISISYSVNVSQTQTNTKAATPAKPTTDPGALPSSIAAIVVDSDFQDITQYPTRYKGEAIPRSIFTAGEQKYSQVKNKNKIKQYIIDRVVKYYIYKDILEENNIALDLPQTNPTFLTIESQVPVLEKKVQTEFISTANFAYIFAWYNSPRLEKIRKKLGDSLEPQARAVLEKYQVEFNKPNANVEKIIESANKDEELASLNENDRYLIIENYTQDHNFIDDINLPKYQGDFNSLLFSLTPEKVSEMYTINNGPGKKVHFILYPIKIEEKKYSSFNEIYQAKKSLISSQ